MSVRHIHKEKTATSAQKLVWSNRRLNTTEPPCGDLSAAGQQRRRCCIHSIYNSSAGVHGGSSRSTAPLLS